ncbi:TetR-like C-terminal domain-containing protein [Parvimonas parva]|uniref:TetR-like C-terminal domain-containing protein n=1 Tax=Parvimonas parva TaxID=2769485 RepID=UPI002FD749AF
MTHILYHLKENKEKFIKVLSCESNDLFLGYFKTYLYKVIDEYIFVDKVKDEKFRNFLKNHICCTSVESVKWWIKNQMQESPEQVADYFLKVVEPIIS